MERFQIGTARVDITPPLSIPYLGYEPRHALFHGVHDPLYARAVAIGDGRSQVVIIAADAIGFSNAILGPDRDFTGEVRQAITERTGIPPAHILLASSHAHSTPETINLRRLLDTPAAAPWLDVLIDQIASAAIMATGRQQPCSLTVGMGEVHGLSWNRRPVGADGRIVPWERYDPDDATVSAGPIDPQVGVLCARSREDASCVVIANFACHPVTVQVQPYVSADFPGAAMALVETAMPHCLNSLFLQGACADLNPLSNTADFAAVQRYGLMLGGEIVKIVGRAGAPDRDEIPARIAVASEIVNLAVRKLPPRKAAQQALAQAEQHLSSAGDEEGRREWSRKRRLAEEALILIDRGRKPIPAEVQVIRLGNVALVALPGEPFVELGLAIKEHSVAAHTFVVGYANDWIGYLTTPQAWQQGGYEVGDGPWTRVGPAGGLQLVHKAVELVDRLWQT